MAVDALALARMHLEALYALDARGRLLRHRGDRAAAPPPPFHLVRTPRGNAWLVGASLPDALATRLEAVLAAEPVRDGCDALEPAPPDASAVRALLGATATAAEWRGPAFAFPPTLLAPRAADAPAAEVLADPAREARPGAFGWLRDLRGEARPVTVARGEDGAVIALCHASRRGPVALEAGVETDPAHRRRGAGTAVVRAWAVAVRAEGREPLYSTAWGNVASRGVARALGLECYGEDWRLEPA